MAYADLESVAAITGEFFFDKRLAKFYERHCDDLGGMPGVWNFLINASQIFEKVSKKYGDAGEDYDWIMAVQNYAEKLHGFGKTLPIDRDLKELADSVLKGAKYK